jgi:hypothetical protein
VTERAQRAVGPLPEALTARIRITYARFRCKPLMLADRDRDETVTLFTVWLPFRVAVIT